MIAEPVSSNQPESPASSNIQLFLSVHLRSNRLLCFAVGTLVALGLILSSTDPAASQGQPAKGAHKITLRAIMQELGIEYLRLTNALLIDDFKGLEESARAIEGHPLPEEVVSAIKNKLGRNFRGFERVDEESHKAAADLAKRAAAKDITGSAKAFGRLSEACVSCHKQFRATLRSLSD
jgi:Cytochrome C'